MASCSQLESIQIINFYRDAYNKIHIELTESEYNYIQKSLERVNKNKQQNRERERTKYIKKSNTSVGRKKGQTGIIIGLPAL